MDFWGLSKDKLKALLKDLNLYNNLTKKLWNRWKRLFNKIKYDKSYYLVEYYPYSDMDYITSKSLDVYNKFFSSKPDKNEIVFIPKKSVLWWMKVYKDDNVVDLSFEKVERNLKK